ncbi:universal stress protein [Rubrobacter aplysinae]|uniref:universal stress protein n=1 Tax=Rubrobacter aplysinae TaxID=909625 RepID=UPI001F430D07|nr:universal stress protein [Rubrobacter aplysinae]
MKVLAVSWGSEDPTSTLQTAATISEKMDAELHVAHIWTLLLPSAPEFIESTHCERQEENARRIVEAAVETVEAAGRTIAETHIRLGFPESEIIRLIGEIGAGMVIVGKRRGSLIKRLLAGCEVERIARYAPCPVVLVGPESPLVSPA